MYLGGIVVSWTAFVLAMIVLYYLARLDLPARRAERAVLLTTIFPFAFFFGVVYTESVFLLFVVSSFYAFRTRRWVWGGLFGAVATATRVNGILILPALAWMAWRTAQPDRRDRAWAIIGLALVASGVGFTRSSCIRSAGTRSNGRRRLSGGATIPAGRRCWRRFVCCGR